MIGPSGAALARISYNQLKRLESNPISTNAICLHLVLLKRFTQASKQLLTVVLGASDSGGLDRLADK